MGALGRSMLASGQTEGRDFDLDFQAIMHFGSDVALETHYVPRRSQRIESVLTFFAHDGQTRNLVYANADLHKADQAGEVVRFAHHWQDATGAQPGLLVFDSKATTGAGLAALDSEGIRFLTLRQRNPKLTATLAALPDSAWTMNSSAIALNVDLDTILTVWAAAAYDHLRRRQRRLGRLTPIEYETLATPAQAA